MLWNKVIIDFIIKLIKLKYPIIKERYNTILVIINRFTKYSYLILFNQKYTVGKLRIIIMNKLVQFYRILNKITSNRNKLFISNYQMILILLLEIKLRFFIDYHLKIDKQIKKINRNLEQYL